MKDLNLRSGSAKINYDGKNINISQITKDIYKPSLNIIDKIRLYACTLFCLIATIITIIYSIKAILDVDFPKILLIIFLGIFLFLFYLDWNLIKEILLVKHYKIEYDDNIVKETTLGGKENTYDLNDIKYAYESKNNPCLVIKFNNGKKLQVYRFRDSKGRFDDYRTFYANVCRFKVVVGRTTLFPIFKILKILKKIF